jgi:aryl-alcohol dehydrogenase-like predicted oxidoreductase
MELRRLGRTDLQVSAVGLGVMTFGAKTSQEDGFRQLDMALEAGINLFDTAENYPAPVLAATQGRSEEMLGDWIASRGVRSQVIIGLANITDQQSIHHGLARGLQSSLHQALFRLF